MELKNYHEIIGKLSNYKENENTIELNFIIEEKIEIPKGKIPTETIENLLQEEVVSLN